MKTLTLNEDLYSTLEEYSEETGRPINDLAPKPYNPGAPTKN